MNSEKVTLKFVVVNPAMVEPKTLLSATEGLPVRIIYSDAVEDIKVIDTGIKVGKKK